MGTGRRVEGRIPRLLRRFVLISGTRFLLRGVGLSRPEFTNLEKIKTFILNTKFGSKLLHSCCHALFLLSVLIFEIV
jgi:hypothetical protein